MAKNYEHTGALPIVIGGYGRVLPGTKFCCEMEPAQEEFMVKIGAVKVTGELPADAEAPEPPKQPWPTSWPKTRAEQVTEEGIK